MKKWFVYIVFICSIFGAYAQTRQPKSSEKHPMDSEAFSKMLDETLMSYFNEMASDSNADSIIKMLDDEEDKGEVINDIYCQRLEKINAISPFHLDCNDITLGMIRFFVKNRRGFAKIVLGRSKIYFDLYEAALAKHDMPIELKYLSVIESGLRPQVKSPAGALGLWQFMYGTGKMYGLVENSYIDERMDPVKATEAACKFLKKLYGIYGDWNLALAAYNAGPGNVNKAIRRSGGKRTYWEVRPYLPRETQGYVPNFIAAAYLLTYHKEHNIKPAKNKVHFYQLDTVCLSKGVHMSTIDLLTQWPLEEIAQLNPIYKTKYIPGTDPKQCITGPINQIGKIVSLTDSLYQLESNLFSPKPKTVEILDTIVNTDSLSKTNMLNSVNEKPVTVWHKVRRGETLTSISEKYYVTVEDIRKWNYLRSYTAPIGRNLKIIKGKAPLIQKEPEQILTEKTNSLSIEEMDNGILTPNNTPSKIPSEISIVQQVKTKKEVLNTENVQPKNEIEKPIVFDSVVTIYHTVQRNESVGIIAQKYNVTPEDIKKWNNMSSNWVGIAQQLKILVNVKLMQPELAGKQIDTKQPLKPITNQTKPIKKFYSVKPGDNLIKIADSYGLTVEQMKELNPKIDPNSIRVGEIIRVK
jgi:membrane-bound lytic murein transglycosylase D